MRRSNNLVRWRLAAAAGLAWLAAGMAASAQTRQITPVPHNDTPPVQLGLSVGAPELRIGSTVTICFEASRAGYATLWNVSTAGQVARVFPNSFVPGAGRDAGAMQVAGGRRTCAGGGGDPFRFRVDGPPGMEDVYLLWTARPELQPPVASYADAAAFAAGLGQLGPASTQDWAAVKTTYDIVPPSGPVAPSLPPPQSGGGLAPPPPAPPPARPTQAPAPRPAPSPVETASAGKIYVLAMGANVDKLTKANQDAGLFTKTLVEMFQIDRSQVRVVSNARKADFQAGMQWLADSVTPKDLVFVYFSGHGGRVRDPTGTSDDGYDEFLVPYDFETRRPMSLRDAVFSQQLATWINALPTGNVITVVDACHSAGVYRSIESDLLGARKKTLVLPPDIEPATGGATRAAGGAGRVRAKGLLLAAARRDESALEMQDGSVFTMALIRELGAIRSGSFADIFQRATERSRTRSDGKQTPTAVGDLAIARLISFKP